MIKNKKIIGFDFDGTLVDNDIKPKANFKNLFLELRKKGILISIVTGKGLYFIIDFLKKYNLKVDFIVAFDGAYIFNCKEEKIIFSKYLEKTENQNMLNVLNEYKIKKVFFNKSTGYQFINENYFPENASLHKYTKAFDKNFSNILQIYVRDINFKQKEFLEKSIIFFNLYFFNFNGQKTRFSALITNKNINKYNSFLKLLEKENIKKNEVIYFGDSINDLDFFNDSSIYCVAVKDAIKILKEKSNFNMQNNDFVYILKKFF